MKVRYSYLVITVFVITLWGCQNNTGSEKYQNNRDVIVNVQDEVKELEMDDVFIGSMARLFILDNSLLVADYKSENKLIHLFDIRDYKYLTSAISRGQGPNEVTNMGHIGIDNERQEFYISDHGKLKIFSCPLDSTLYSSSYTLSVKNEINNNQFPSEYEFICDTLTFARMIEPTGNSGYNEFLAKWNMRTGKVDRIKYSHPKVDHKRVSFAASMDKECIIECYHNHDLMTIMDLDGNLRCNVYGSNWNDSDSEKLNHFGKPVFCKDKIVASYSGGDRLGNEYFPTKLLVFDIEGNYVKTIETGYRIVDFCYDEKNNNIIFNFEDVIQFGYLNLDGIL